MGQLSCKPAPLVWLLPLAAVATIQMLKAGDVQRAAYALKSMWINMPYSVSCVAVNCRTVLSLASGSVQDMHHVVAYISAITKQI